MALWQYSVDLIPRAGLDSDAEAQPLYREALAILTTLFGPDHPSTVKVRGNYERFAEDHGVTGP